MTLVSRSILRGCVATATLAPSLHNSQPWRFAIDAPGVVVFADRDRQLTALDPAGRELLISVGAAIFTLRLAIRGAGWIPPLDRRPEPDRPDRVARVWPGRPAPSTDAVRDLLATVPRRHTNR